MLLSSVHQTISLMVWTLQQSCPWDDNCGFALQVEEEDSLVCVLLDEVESLTRARSAAVSGSEPADAIRAVNALLTQVLPQGLCHSALLRAGSNLTSLAAII